MSATLTQHGDRCCFDDESRLFDYYDLMMEIRWLRAAAAVAEHLHFGRAATSLDIAQSQISQQVAALERDLGVRLFDRDSRNVAPTAAGASFVADARAALERLDAAAGRARAAGRGEHGTLAVGTVGSALSAPCPAS